MPQDMSNVSSVALLRYAEALGIYVQYSLLSRKESVLQKPSLVTRWSGLIVGICNRRRSVERVRTVRACNKVRRATYIGCRVDGKFANVAVIIAIGCTRRAASVSPNLTYWTVSTTRTGEDSCCL